MANLTLPGTGQQILEDTFEGGKVFPPGGMTFGPQGGLERVTDANPLPVQVASAVPLTATGTFTEGPSTNVKFAPINTAASGASPLVPGVAGKKIRVVGFHLIAAGAVNVSFRSAANAITGPYPLVANSGLAPNGGGFGVFETVAGEALNINLSAAVQVSGALTYLEI